MISLVPFLTRSEIPRCGSAHESAQKGSSSPSADTSTLTSRRGGPDKRALNVNMAVHAMHGQMDYSLDSKQGKMLEDRLDSGVDSLKDETLMIEDFKDLTVRCKEENTEEWEPWRDAVTEDGDT